MIRYGTVRRPGHPRAEKSNGNVLEHILIVEAAMGKFLPLRAKVHHVNENRRDNRNQNLVVCEDQAYHMLLHLRARALAACGNANWRKCHYCKRYDELANLTLIATNRVGDTYHKACKAQYERERQSRIRSAS